jgi:hypothetical protein
MREGCPLSPLLFNSFGIPSQRNMTGGRKKSTLNLEEVQLSLFADDIILYPYVQ